MLKFGAIMSEIDSKDSPEGYVATRPFHGCAGCTFQHGKGRVATTCAYMVRCLSTHRLDGRSVIFKEVDKVFIIPEMKTPDPRKEGQAIEIPSVVFEGDFIRKLIEVLRHPKLPDYFSSRTGVGQAVIDALNLIPGLGFDDEDLNYAFDNWLFNSIEYSLRYKGLVELLERHRLERSVIEAVQKSWFNHFRKAVSGD